MAKSKTYGLSEDDVKILQRVINRVAKSPGGLGPSIVNDPSGHYLGLIARVPGGGIPPLAIGSPDEPGQATCNIYRIDRSGTSGATVVAVSGLSKTVYNLSTSRIESRYCLVQQLGSGVYVTFDNGATELTGTGTACVSVLDGVDLSELPVESSPSYVLGLDSMGCLVRIPVGSCP